MEKAAALKLGAPAVLDAIHARAVAALDAVAAPGVPARQRHSLDIDVEDAASTLRLWLADDSPHAALDLAGLTPPVGDTRHEVGAAVVEVPQRLHRADRNLVADAQVGL